MAVYFHESRETIDLLRRIVDKLDENDGRINAEDLWDGVQCVPSNARSSNPAVARHGMRQMEDLLDGLQSFVSILVSTYKSQLSTTRQRVRIPRLTVDSLPNEIIHHIVNDTFEPCYYAAASLLKYSHISSRFRTVILDSPSLWASIPLTLSTPSNMIAAILSRSASLGLTVDLFITGVESEPQLFTARKHSVNSSSALSKLSAIFKHHHRWREVQLTLDDDESAKFIQDNFPRANLTSTRKLEVYDEGFKTRVNFLKNWGVPQLGELHWRSILVPPPSGMATQMLHTCSLSLGPEASNLTSIATFLNVASGLRTLSLFLNFLDDVGPLVEVQEMIRLSCLELLVVGHDPDSQTDAVARLLKAILCPGLKHLVLGTNTPDDYFDFTQDMQGRYPVLTSFTLCIGKHFPMQSFSFEDILCSMPNTIKNLKIYTTYNYSGELYASRRNNIASHDLFTSYPNLTNLDVEGCNIREESFYANLSEILSRFRVFLTQFRPRMDRTMKKDEMELAKKNAVMTLQHAGVLDDLTSTSEL